MELPQDRALRIEALVTRLRESLVASNPRLDVADGISSLLTLANRLAKSMLLLSAEEDREANREAICQLLREMADELENVELAKLTLH